MHFEILVEDQSGKKMLDNLIPKILGEDHTYNIHPYKGIGKIPKDLKEDGDPSKRILLMQLPRLLRGYGKAFAKYPNGYLAAIIVICDLDQKCLKEFRKELFELLDTCNPIPVTRFCIAIEEGEAWFLGDPEAIKSAYPKAKERVINTYVNDSICATWETLADAIYPGGTQALSAKGWQAIGTEKFAWAENISPHMDINNNASPSFNYLRSKISELIENP
jgi:hypothetical protein